MMLDENAKSDYELAELVSRVNNFYTRKGLSPPFFLRDAAREWHGLSQEEIVAVLEKHFDACRRFYTSGSGDAHFGMVRSAIHKAIEAKHSPRDHAGEEPDRPRPPRRSSSVRQVHNACGFPDVFVEGRAARLVRSQVSNVERSSSLVGYESTGSPINEDDVEADA
jgi:hypothetical protein